VPRYGKCLSNGDEYVENSLKNVESDNNKILYETLLDFFTAKRYLLSEYASYHSVCGALIIDTGLPAVFFLI